MKFLDTTEVGNRTPEKEAREREEEKDNDWGWEEEERETSDSESAGAEDECAPTESDTELEDAEDVIQRFINVAKETRGHEEGEGVGEKYG